MWYVVYASCDEAALGVDSRLTSGLDETTAVMGAFFSGPDAESQIRHLREQGGIKMAGRGNCR